MKGWIYLVACVVLLAAPSRIIAQIIMPEALGFEYSLTVGASFSVNNDVDNSTSPMVGIAWYGAASDVFGENAAFGLSGDWIGIKTNSDRDVSLVPIMFNYKRYGHFGPYRLFTNLGIGILAATDNIPEMLIDNGANFGWTGGFGIDLTNQLFGQFRFIAGSHTGQDGLSTIQLGYRF
ncbi:hypothetical protein LLG46_04555 [bacterium]|nr:hypothetical protein [bacterium]